MLNCTIDEAVAMAMSAWRIPGLALTVVHRGDVLFEGVYGITDVNQPEAVTPGTSFLICSLTKAFTAAGVGLLAEAGQLRWNTRVRDLIPELRLRDAFATEHLTLMDLLCHRSGLAAHDRIWSPGDLTPQQMLAALRHLEPGAPFREAFQYSNIGYWLAGQACARACGQSWEEFILRRLLKPLGFHVPAFALPGGEPPSQVAHPHEMEEGVLRRGTAWPMSATPAGGLLASIRDMSQWLVALCSAFAGTPGPVLSTALARHLTTPRVYLGESEHAELGSRHYGIGFFCESYRQSPLASHTGSQLGWSAYHAVMPREQIGVAVLTNCDPNPVRELLAYLAFDLVMKREPVDWHARFLARKEADIEKERSEGERRRARRDRTPLPRPLTDYAGTYTHPAYGRMEIAADGDVLWWRWRGFRGMLRHCHYDSFDVEEQPVARYPAGLQLTFLYDADGTIDRLSSPLEPAVAPISFRREAAAAEQ